MFRWPKPSPLLQNFLWWLNHVIKIAAFMLLSNGKYRIPITNGFPIQTCRDEAEFPATKSQTKAQEAGLLLRILISEE